MAEVQSKMNDEIDLFDLVDILWSGKVVLGFCMAMGLLFSGVLISNHEVKYETVIKFEVLDLPPSISFDRFVADLRQEFQNSDSFSQWFETAPNAQLKLEDVAPTVLIDGVLFSADIDSSATVLLSRNSIVIRSSNTNLIENSMSYAQFVADKVKLEYTQNYKVDYDLLQAFSDQLFARYKNETPNFTFQSSKTLERLEEIDFFLKSINNGKELVRFPSHPTQPVALSSSKRALLLIPFLIGSIVGVLFVVLRHTYRKRKHIIEQIPS